MHTDVHIFEDDPAPKVSLVKWEREGTVGLSLEIGLFDGSRPHQVKITVFDAHADHFRYELTKALFALFSETGPEGRPDFGEQSVPPSPGETDVSTEDRDEWGLSGNTNGEQNSDYERLTS